MDTPLETTLGGRLTAYLNSSEDYRKQRQRLNKQLKRLRHELGLVVRDTKNYSKKAKTKEISAEQVKTNDKYALLLLLTAERDMLYANEVKLQLETADNHGNYKTLMITKMRRSISYIKQLLSIIPQANPKEVLQLYVYAALGEGQVAITRRQWKKAVYAFAVARVSVDFLISQKFLDNTLLYDIIDTIIDPSLNLALSKDGAEVKDLKSASRKYCHSNVIPYLGKAVDIVHGLDPSFVADLSSQVELIDSIEWRGHHAKLYNEELAYKIMNLQELTKTTDLTTLEAFDSLISGWGDAVDLHKEDTAKNQDEDDSENVQNRAILMTYLRYNLLFTTIKRDLLLVSQIEFEGKLKDCHRVSQGIIQATKQLEDLPGVYNDDDLHTSLQHLEAYFSAKLNELVADCYHKAHKFPEALKILASVYDLLDIADEVYKVDFPYELTTNEEYAAYKLQLHSKLVQCQLTTQIAQQGHGGIIAEDINMVPSVITATNVINISKKPRIYPILSKPVLFDVAFNYINMAGNATLTQPTPEPAEETPEEEKKKGLFGFFGRR